MLCGILNFLKHFARIFTTTLLWSIFSSGCGACVTRVYVSLFLLLYNFRNAIVIMKLVARATFHLRIANRVGEDSCCRGGIVNTRCGCSRAQIERPNSSTALWRFRASTSNILIDRYMPPTYTHARYIHHTYAQQDIQVYEDDHFQPPIQQ
jgi:hypothetical protein